MKATKQNLVNVMQSDEYIHLGATGRKLRRDRIKLLASVVRGNFGWRKAFTDQFPQFDTREGIYALNRATTGRTDDRTLLLALEQFIPEVIATQPAWWKKRPNPLPEL